MWQFGDLPDRDPQAILGLLVSDGSLDVLRTSRGIIRDATELFFQYSEFRIRFALRREYSFVRNPRPNPEHMDKIQNISLRVYMRLYPAYGSMPELDLLQKFGGSKISRKLCKVTFECYVANYNMVTSDVLEVLKTYTGFEKLFLNIELENGEPLSAEIPESRKAAILERKHQGYLTALEWLNPSLGEANGGHEKG